jgi:hypothetical protein
MKGQDEGDQDAHGNGQHQRDRGNDRSPSRFHSAASSSRPSMLRTLTGYTHGKERFNWNRTKTTFPITHDLKGSRT